jgi:hypothetical protein
MTAAEQTRETPFMVVLRGQPDDEEVAAATLALLALVNGEKSRGRAESGPKPAGWVAENGYTPPGFWATH